MHYELREVPVDHPPTDIVPLLGVRGAATCGTCHGGLVRGLIIDDSREWVHAHLFENDQLSEV